MKLMTDEIATALVEAAGPDGYGGTDGLDPVPIVVKYFDPTGSWSWYATEGEKVGPGKDDWVLFGLVDGFEKELGSFSLKELAGVKGPLGLGIERDLYFEGMGIRGPGTKNEIVKLEDTG